MVTAYWVRVMEELCDRGWECRCREGRWLTPDQASIHRGALSADIRFLLDTEFICFQRLSIHTLAQFIHQRM